MVWSEGRKKVLDRIQECYERTPPRERPVWATGCLWFYHRLPSSVSIDDFPYDFGVWQDLSAVKMNRASKDWPFEYAPGFRARIEARRAEVNRAPRVPRTPPVYDRRIVHTPRSSDAETLLLPYGVRLQSNRHSSPSVPISSPSSDTEDRIAPQLKTKKYAPAGDDSIHMQALDDEEVSLATALFESNQRRIRALARTCPSRKQVSKESIPDPSDSSSESEEQPEVDHPKVNAKHGIDASSTVGTVHPSLGIDSVAFGSAVSLHAAPPCSSSSASISSSSTTSSSDPTSRSRSIRGKSPSPVCSQVDFGTD